MRIKISVGCFFSNDVDTVSYTHLDVYKRQELFRLTCSVMWCRKDKSPNARGFRGTVVPLIGLDFLARIGYINRNKLFLASYYILNNKKSREVSFQYKHDTRHF